MIVADPVINLFTEDLKKWKITHLLITLNQEMLAHLKIRTLDTGSTAWLGSWGWGGVEEVVHGGGGGVELLEGELPLSGGGSAVSADGQLPQSPSRSRCYR